MAFGSRRRAKKGSGSPPGWHPVDWAARRAVMDRMRYELPVQMSRNEAMRQSMRDIPPPRGYEGCAIFGNFGSRQFERCTTPRVYGYYERQSPRNAMYDSIARRHARWRDWLIKTHYPELNVSFQVPGGTPPCHVTYQTPADIQKCQYDKQMRQYRLKLREYREYFDPGNQEVQYFRRHMDRLRAAAGTQRYWQ